jgi:REP element-mobilizing transposase RayT
MSTHYHLILECRTAALSPAMRRLNGRYARHYNDRHDRFGHVFGERYASFVIQDEDHYTVACRYIAANPVEASLCTAVEDWPWTWIADLDAGDQKSNRAVDPTVKGTS